MENEQNITVDFLKTICQPSIFDSYDKISNLPEQHLANYAYVLQESLVGVMSSKIDAALEDEYVLLKEPLEKMILPMENLSVKHINFEFGNYKPSRMLDIVELSFMVWTRGVGRIIILRSGFLLKLLLQEGIKSFDEIEQYNAAVIYNSLDVNPEISAFVNFEKKDSIKSILYAKKVAEKSTNI